MAIRQSKSRILTVGALLATQGPTTPYHPFAGLSHQDAVDWRPTDFEPLGYLHRSGPLGAQLGNIRRDDGRLAPLGVPKIVGEQVIGHGPRGLVAIYNMHQYATEKRDALDRWARELHDIVTPPPENVVRLAASGAA